MTDNPVSLAEPLGTLSLAMDLAAGLPQGCALATTVLAVRIGERHGLSNEDLRATYYGAVTRFLGCTATATEAASFALGRDQELNMALGSCDWVDADQVQAALQSHVAKDAPSIDRASAFAAIRENHASIPVLTALHCAQAIVLATRLPLPPGVTSILGHMYDRWDGEVEGASGEDIPLPARIIPLALCAELFRRAGGVDSAVEVVRARAGGQLDPELCSAFAGNARELFEGFERGIDWQSFLDAEPCPRLGMEPTDLNTVAEVFGDFADAKSAWMLGHSRRVSGLAAAAGQLLDLDSETVERLRLAALVHDLGRVAVPNQVWDRPSVLTFPERQQVETHTYHTSEILRRSPVLRQFAECASGAHERCDGSGYHRRVHLDDAPTTILAAADMFDALTHHRPWRHAHPAEGAELLMVREVTGARLPRRVVDAVLEAAGHERRVTRPELPGGLTPREADVLSLLAVGCSDKAIAGRLGISVKTAGHHVSSVCRKTGTQGRAQVAIWALEHKALLT
jgi:HD-GYP domain-containing protein (c-di-GMP phosphodiesterase class II)